MIMRDGIKALLYAFSSPVKDGYKITRVEFGNDMGIGRGTIPEPINIDTDPSEFEYMFGIDLVDGTFDIEDNKELKLFIELDDSVMNTPESVYTFSSIRLKCANGTTFAWRRFEKEIIFTGFLVSFSWDIILDTVCVENIVIPEVFSLEIKPCQKVMNGVITPNSIALVYNNSGDQIGAATSNWFGDFELGLNSSVKGGDVLTVIAEYDGAQSAPEQVTIGESIENLRMRITLPNRKRLDCDE